jgi:16S rRNA (adenine1518-N6/adenine1519-N6)-dimethyltransferase
MQALDGLRVIDMATVFAGPGAARHLADFGADVVKVESPSGDGVPAVERFLVMVQREVGERLAAEPGTRAYGIPSVKVAYWATAEVVGKVSREVFLPKPKVDSVLVRLTRRPDGPATAADPVRLFELVRTGFGQRRKMLRGALAGLVAPSAFEEAGVRPEARAEELAVEEWGRLADASG